MRLSAEEIARAVHGRLIQGDREAWARGVSTDSRKIAGGELFVPLRGPRFDGHDFIGSALAQGANGALIEEGRMDWAKRPEAKGKFLIAVRDGLRALGDLARDWRSRQRAQVIAITGSNGKTTTKEMTAGILSGRHRVLKTEGNLNNLVGLPMMLLRLTAEEEFAVLEMGMSRFGEIRRLKEIADPTVSLITNIAPVHTEFLGSIEGVARAKGELWEDLRESDWIAVNVDDPRVQSLAAPLRCQKRTYGLRNEAQIQGRDLRVEPGRGIQFSMIIDGSEHPVRLNLFGRHQVSNALAAAALASIVGVPTEGIVAGLEKFQPYPGRGKLLAFPGSIQVWDESYNSNPVSLEATLRAFIEMKDHHRGLAVVGDMLELGSGSAQWHEEIGRRIAAMALEHLLAVGTETKHLLRGAGAAGMEAHRLHWAQSPEEILSALIGLIREGDWIFVKGSRGMALERVIEGLRRHLEKRESEG